jgi:hypothetical protein
VVKLENESNDDQEEILFDNIEPAPKLEKQKPISKKRKTKRRRRLEESEDDDDDDGERYRKIRSKKSKRRDHYEDSELESDVSVKKEYVQKTFKCPEVGCDKVYRSKAVLEAHQREHLGEDVSKQPFFKCLSNNLCTICTQPTACDICNKKLSTIKSMLKHKKTHEKDADKVFAKKEPSDDSMKRFHKCTTEGCRKSYRLFATLEAHMRTHEGDGTEVS